jgi:putative PIN family toxin of toxin-antitoxin system
MRVVIDTNVVVSGIINPHGAPGRVLDAVLARAVLVLHDDRILDEYRQVLRRPVFSFAQRHIDALLDFIETSGEHVSTRDIGVVLPDPTDLPFLEVAILGGADALITGNLKHFRPTMGRYKMNVWPPHEFMKRLPEGTC